mmetsp:Transcript_2554/g.7091  ORF Transcript_2554/g.7091 Transcript_2554/m.7091 type:complete len:273 (+) Transcript_2554:49-867(+)
MARSSTRRQLRIVHTTEHRQAGRYTTKQAFQALPNHTSGEGRTDQPDGLAGIHNGCAGTDQEQQQANPGWTVTGCTAQNSNLFIVNRSPRVISQLLEIHHVTYSTHDTTWFDDGSLSTSEMLCHITPLSWTVMDRSSVATSSTLLYHPSWTWSDQLSGFTSTPSCMQSALALVLTTSTFHHCCLQPPPVLCRSIHFDDVCRKPVQAEEYVNWTLNLSVFPCSLRGIPVSSSTSDAGDLPVGIAMYDARWVLLASACVMALFSAWFATPRRPL